MRTLLLLTFLLTASAFTPSTRPQTRIPSFIRAVSPTHELAPEPLEGALLADLGGLEGSMMKDMGDGSYWLKWKASGEEISKLKSQILRDASKKAQFPGFRKGQIPPYAMPQMTTFALQEAITNSLEVVVKAYGLRTLSGSEGNIDVKEKVEDIAKTWKSGDVEYTATFKGEPDSDATSPTLPTPPTSDA